LTVDPPLVCRVANSHNSIVEDLKWVVFTWQNAPVSRLTIEKCFGGIPQTPFRVWATAPVPRSHPRNPYFEIDGFIRLCE